MKYRTKQEIYDTACSGLATQGFARSTNSSGDSCQYRGADGRRCAIGWCISDARYTRELESSTPVTVVLRAARIPYRYEAFATYLQMCHDDALSRDDMIRELRGFAEAYGLRPHKSLVKP